MLLCPSRKDMYPSISSHQQANASFKFPPGDSGDFFSIIQIMTDFLDPVDGIKIIVKKIFSPFFNLMGLCLCNEGIGTIFFNFNSFFFIKEIITPLLLNNSLIQKGYHNIGKNLFKIRIDCKTNLELT